MGRQTNPQLAAELASLSKGLETHRNKRRRQRNLPEALWTQAAELARQHGVCRVHQALRLNYNDLKRRVAELPAPVLKSTRPAFVELQVPPLSVASSVAILELEDRSGRKLTVRLSKDAGVEWAAAAQALWSCA